MEAKRVEAESLVGSLHRSEQISENEDTSRSQSFTGSEESNGSEDLSRGGRGRLDGRQDSSKSGLSEGDETSLEGEDRHIPALRIELARRVRPRVPALPGKF